MKILTTLACLSIAAACLAQTAEAQQLRFGPIGISLNGGRTFHDHHNHRSSYYPHISRYPSHYDHNHRPDKAEPGRYRPNPWETPAYVGPKQVEKLVYNTRTGRWEVKVAEEVINQSALDPNRDVVDPGSYRQKSSISFDHLGNRVETTVTSWTSHGVPRSKTTTRNLSQAGNVNTEPKKTELPSIGFLG